MSGELGKILALKLYIESSDFIYNYTGKISKAILLTEAPSLEYLFKPMKGFYKPLRVSPPIHGNRAVIPTYIIRREHESRSFYLEPVKLNGEYVVEVGSTNEIVDRLYNVFKASEGLKTRIKFENTIVGYVVSEVRVFKPEVRVSSAVIIKTLSPALLPNPFIPSQHVRKFTASPSTLLWVPHAIANGVSSHSTNEVIKALVLLESCLAEHYAIKFKVVFINYDNKREPALDVKAKYLLINQMCKEQLEKTLCAARIFGVGASRASGFGSIEVVGF